MFGPSVSPYEHAEHAFWLLSSASSWLPERVHAILLEGMASWSAWVWTDGKEKVRNENNRNALLEALLAAGDEGKRFRWTKAIEEDALNRIEFAIATLKLPDSPMDILERFVEYGFPGKYITDRQKLHNRRQKRQGSGEERLTSRSSGRSSPGR